MKKRGLNNLRLKIVGLVLVILSAVGTAFVRKGMPGDLNQASLTQLTWSILLEAISWTGLPIYAWLTVTGFLHTSSVVRYGVRLLVLGLAAEVPYDLATTGKVWDMSSQNPALALVVVLIVLHALDRLGAQTRGVSLFMRVAVVVAGVLWMLLLNIGLRLVLPGGVVMLLFALIFRYLSNRENIMNLVGCVLGALAGIFPAFGLAILHFRNGEQGMGPVGKWFFYAAYPVCLLGLGLAGLWS